MMKGILTWISYYRYIFLLFIISNSTGRLNEKKILFDNRNNVIIQWTNSQGFVYQLKENGKELWGKYDNHSFEVFKPLRNSLTEIAFYDMVGDEENNLIGIDIETNYIYQLLPDNDHYTYTIGKIWRCLPSVGHFHLDYADHQTSHIVIKYSENLTLVPLLFQSCHNVTWSNVFSHDLAGKTLFEKASSLTTRKDFSIDLEDFTFNPGFYFGGPYANAAFGSSVSIGGDVNKDGRGDLLIGAYGISSVSGKAFLIYGASSYSTLNFNSLTASQGVTYSDISSSSSTANFGYAVAVGGDFNKDGYADFAIGSPKYTASGGGGNRCGRVVLIYGSASLSSLDIAQTLSSSSVGFIITGYSSTAANIGNSLSFNDINNDGYADLLIGITSGSSTGKVYLLFGTTTALFDITVSSNGKLPGAMAIYGNSGSPYPGSPVSIGGDVNGDGYRDMLIGAYNENSNVGAAYLVFGGLNQSDVVLNSNMPVNRGLRIGGMGSGSYFGFAVSVGGDANGDGKADLLVGAYGYSGYDGMMFLIYGNSNLQRSFNVTSMTISKGITIKATSMVYRIGFGVSLADVNHDGLADIVFAAPSYSSTTGAIYVIFGRSNLVNIDLQAGLSSSQGVMIVNTNLYATAQSPAVSFSAGGDLNNDDQADIVIGNPSLAGSGLSAIFLSQPMPTSQPSGSPTSQPSRQPSGQPTRQPSSQPSRQPSTQPTRQPSCQPTSKPSSQPTSKPSIPTSAPSSLPSRQPTGIPSCQPISLPTSQPSSIPSCQPASRPSAQPSGLPSSQPSRSPSRIPTSQPTQEPSSVPTRQPLSGPSSLPTNIPSAQPSGQPTRHPTIHPTTQPTGYPTTQPTRKPTCQPSAHPTKYPSSHPSRSPTNQPTLVPSRQPTAKPSMLPTSQPSSTPTNKPTTQPSRQPSTQPTAQPTSQPSRKPTSMPSRQPSVRPTAQPTSQPSRKPTSMPSRQPSVRPTAQPTEHPTSQPSRRPSTQPTSRPSAQPSSTPSAQPFSIPSGQPSSQPTRQPSSRPTVQPSAQPVRSPTSSPTVQPSRHPSSQPTARPSSQPSGSPSRQPTSHPSVQPTAQPSSQPTAQPSVQPISVPTGQPSSRPSRRPTCIPSSQPSSKPSCQPTTQPICHPTSSPTAQPNSKPTYRPSSQPSVQPSVNPSGQPSKQPVSFPTTYPTFHPSSKPSFVPTRNPTAGPSSQPSGKPSGHPSSPPSSQPTTRPSSQPTGKPTNCPSSQPAGKPSSQPSTRPSFQPTELPTSLPSSQPTGKPSSQSSSKPSCQPTGQPTNCPTRVPIGKPSGHPSAPPSSQPTTRPSSQPTGQPTSLPSGFPSGFPTRFPTCTPSTLPTSLPSNIPSVKPSSQPFQPPSTFPTTVPTSLPVGNPTTQPIPPSTFLSLLPTNRPSSEPSNAIYSTTPSSQPSSIPSELPSLTRTSFPTQSPSPNYSSRLPVSQPSTTPSLNPFSRPTTSLSGFPSSVPSVHPTFQPIDQRSTHPTFITSHTPSAMPSVSSTLSESPTSIPMDQPSLTSSRPSIIGTDSPTSMLTNQPSLAPTSFPTSRSSSSPSAPTSKPSEVPSGRPTIIPTRHPSSQPTRQPSSRPSGQPLAHPTSVPSITPTLARPLTESPSFFPSPSGPTISVPTVSPTFKPTSSPTSTISAYPSSRQFRGWLFLFGLSSSTRSTVLNNVYLNSPYLGTSYIVFGRKKGDDVALISEGSSPSLGVMEVKDGGVMQDTQTRSTTNIGDITGDGREDWLMGDPSGSKCYVLFGSSSSMTNLRVSMLITENGESSSVKSGLGWASSGLGDLNEDRYGDFIVSAPSVNAVYVVFGRATRNFPNQLVLLTMTGRQGFKIIGSRVDRSFGMSVSSAGDFNGDGHKDIVISALRSTSSSQSSIYVIAGNGSASMNFKSLSIDTMGNSSYYKIVTQKNSFIGLCISGVGDMNGDGFHDIIVGSSPYQSVGILDQVSYIIFGRQWASQAFGSSNTLSLASWRSSVDGLVIRGGGFVVAGLGDVNGDGLADVMVSNYGGWLGKSSAYIAVFPSNVTSFPSMSPTSHPSSRTFSPSSFMGSPSNCPSSEPTAITSTTLTPNLSQTKRPTKSSIPSFSPTRQMFTPSLMPSSRSKAPSLIPTVNPSAVPTAVRASLRPSFAAKVSPAPSKHRPSMFPTSWPSTASPTETSSESSSQQETITIDVNSPGDYHPPDVAGGRKNLVIGVNGSLRILASAGRTVYTILPRNSEVQIDLFRSNYDQLDLTHFPRFRNIGQLPHQSHPLRLLLSADQSVVLSSHDALDLSTGDVIFSDRSSSSSSGSSQSSLMSSSPGALAAGISFSVLLVLVGVTVVGYFYYRKHLQSGRSLEEEKGFKLFSVLMQSNSNTVKPAVDRRNLTKERRISQSKTPFDIGFLLEEGKSDEAKDDDDDEDDPHILKEILVLQDIQSADEGGTKTRHRKSNNVQRKTAMEKALALLRREQVEENEDDIESDFLSNDEGDDWSLSRSSVGSSEIVIAGAASSREPRVQQSDSSSSSGGSGSDNSSEANSLDGKIVSRSLAVAGVLENDDFDLNDLSELVESDSDAISSQENEDEER